MIKLVVKKIRIIIPAAVLVESTIKKELFDAQLIKMLVDSKKITVEDVDQAYIKQLMNDFSIERGEAEAISLAKKENPPWQQMIGQV